MAKLPLATRNDVYESLAISVLGPTSWLAPQRSWLGLAKVYTRLLTTLRRRTTATRVQVLGRAIEGLPGGHDPHRLRHNLFHGYMMERMAILREYRPGGWKTRISIRGREYLDSAARQGHGAVLWLAPLTYIDFVAKKGLAEAGYSVSHLSVMTRGFDPNGCYLPDPSVMSRKVLSPLRTRVEDGYLRERIEIEPDGGLGYARTLLRRVAENGIVSLRAGSTGERTVAVTFFDGTIDFATGAASLAASSGAPLLPVFAVPTGANSFDVIIEAPIALPENDPDAVSAAVEAFAHRLQQFVTDWPHLWSGWYDMRFER